MKKRILSLCVCFVLVFSFFLTSCELDYETIDIGEIESAIRSEISTKKDEAETDGDRENNENNNNSNQKDEEKKPPIEFPDIGGEIELPEYDFKNVEIVALTDIGAPNNFPLFSNNGSDYLNSMLYKRQIAIEDMLNVSINNRICDLGDFNRFLNHARAILISGEDLEIIEGHSRAMLVLAAEGLLSDLNSLEGINTEAPYWSENAVRDLSTSNGSLFFIDGAISLGNMMNAEVMFFNERLMENYRLDSVYGLVMDGKWTVEEFKRMSLNVATDNDGIPEFNIESDIFGYVTQERHLAMFSLYHTGENSVIYDTEKSRFVMNWNSKKTFEAYDNVMSVVNSIAGYCGELEEKHQVENAFREGRALFCTDVFINMSYLSCEGEVDIGVAPLPKPDLDAENYCTPIYVDANLYSISGLSAKANEAAFVMELMSAYGYARIFDEYMSKSLTNEAQTESVKLIFSSLNYDLTYLGDMGTSSIISSLMNENPLQSTIVSYSAKILNERTNWDTKASLSIGK